jgi:hypothetical protein
MKNTFGKLFILLILLLSSCSNESRIEEKILNDIAVDLAGRAREYIVPPLSNDEAVVILMGDILGRPLPYYLESTQRIEKKEISNEKLRILECFQNGDYEDQYIKPSNIFAGRFTKIVSEDTSNQDGLIIGHLSLSPILLSEEKNLGVFLLSFKCKGDCGYNELVFIKKENERWIISEIFTLGIS